MTFFTSRSNRIETAISNIFLLDNCTWVRNTAHIGAAVDMSPHVFDRAKEGFLPTESLSISWSSISRLGLVFSFQVFSMSILWDLLASGITQARHLLLSMP